MADKQQFQCDAVESLDGRKKEEGQIEGRNRGWKDTINGIISDLDFVVFFVAV